MKHKWDKKHIDKYYNLIQICKRCGCHKCYNSSAGKPYITYERSGHTWWDYAPDCIDWEVENQKTID